MTAFLFPGQGSQAPGMGKDAYAAGGAAREVFDWAAELNPPGFLDILFEGPAETLSDTRMAQPALLTAEVAMARALQMKDFAPSVCAGHSVGEIPALVVAGACTFHDAMRLIHERARLTSEGVPAGGMAAVMGLTPAEIEAALPESVDIANYNGPQQTIISGSKDGLAAAEKQLKEAGAKRVIPLNVSGPFHSTLMHKAAQEFRAFLANVSFIQPKLRFVSSVTGLDASDPEEIRTLLWKQLYHPVLWTHTMQHIGPMDAIEVGPGNVLQGLAKRIEGAPIVRAWTAV